MAIKHALLLVFVTGISIIGGIVEAQHTRICPGTCLLGTTYMTCPTTGALRLRPACNCCMAPEGECVIYKRRGIATECESRPRTCPRNLEPADYMTCSYTGNVQLQPSGNCCTAPDGCYFHLDGHVTNCTAKWPRRLAIH